MPADTQPAPSTTTAKRMRSTGFSSKRFGPCEVCGEHCADVWIGGLGKRGADSVFGHESCVAKAVA